jgi:hypothetical protein
MSARGFAFSAMGAPWRTTLFHTRAIATTANTIRVPAQHTAKYTTQGAEGEVSCSTAQHTSVLLSALQPLRLQNQGLTGCLLLCHLTSPLGPKLIPRAASVRL